MLREVLLLLQRQVRLCAGPSVVERVQVDADAATAPPARVEAHVPQTQAELREIVYDVVAVIVLIFSERDLHLDPGTLVRVVPDLGKPFRVATLVFDAA